MGEQASGGPAPEMQPAAELLPAVYAELRRLAVMLSGRLHFRRRPAACLFAHIPPPSGRSAAKNPEIRDSPAAPFSDEYVAEASACPVETSTRGLVTASGPLAGSPRRASGPLAAAPRRGTA